MGRLCRWKTMMMPTGDDAYVGVEGKAIGMLCPLFVSISFSSSSFYLGFG